MQGIGEWTVIIRLYHCGQASYGPFSLGIVVPSDHRIRLSRVVGDEATWVLEVELWGKILGCDRVKYGFAFGVQIYMCGDIFADGHEDIPQPISSFPPGRVP